MSKIHKWHSLNSLEFSLLCFERVPSTRRVLCATGDPFKKLNPELVKDDYERLTIIRKAKVDKKI